MTRAWPASLLLAYPPGWRARYGDELDVLVSDLQEHGRKPVPMAFDLLRGAAAAWCRTRRGFAMSERSRNALTSVLWSWVAFAATAAWFGHDLGSYPNRSAARQIALVHPAVPDAYHVLVGVGVVAVAATALAAVSFALEAGRYARSHRRNSIVALMALPPVTAAAWLGVVQLIGRTDSTAGMTFAVLWLLLGLAGIAWSTQAVITIVRTCEFSRTAWRIGAGAAAAVTAAMLTGTGATIVWGLAFRASQGHSAGTSGWLIVTAIMAVTSARAVIALIGARRAPAPAPAVA
jgi:NADH:ubiquinone oxidoreductase subunit K